MFCLVAMRQHNPRHAMAKPTAAESKRNEINYKKRQSYCVSFLRKEKARYYNELNLSLIKNNKIITHPVALPSWLREHTPK